MQLGESVKASCPFSFFPMLLFFLLPSSLRSTSFTFHGLCRLITYCLTGLSPHGVPLFPPFVLSFSDGSADEPRCHYGNTWRNVTSAVNTVNGVRVPRYLSIGICCRDSGSPPTFVALPLRKPTSLVFLIIHAYDLSWYLASFSSSKWISFPTIFFFLLIYIFGFSRLVRQFCD